MYFSDPIALSVLIRSKLTQVLHVLDNGEIPKEAERKEVKQLLQNYLDLLANDTHEAASTKISRYKIVMDDITDGTMEACDVLSKSDYRMYLEVLFEIGIKKLISVNAAHMQDEIIYYLKSNKYIAQISITCDNKATNYYMLTAKGWRCFAEKEKIIQLKKDPENAAFLIPACFTASPKEWLDVTYLKAQLIQKYYQQIESDDNYMIFCFEENQQLLFGCKMEEDAMVQYTCAIVFEDIISENDIATLKRVVSDEDVDRVTILCMSEFDLQIFRNQNSFEKNSLDKMKYKVVRD